MRTIIAAIVLVLFSTAVDARTRIVVRPGQPIFERQPLRNHPYAVEYVLSYIFCGFHVFSVGPNPKPGQLGECASWFNYVSPRQRVRRA